MELLNLKVELFKKYLLQEIDYISCEIWMIFRDKYQEFITNEKKLYKASPKYKKIMRSKQASKGVDDGLNEILSTLDYWVPSTMRGDGDAHITYSSGDDNAFVDMNATPEGFVYPMLQNDFIQKELDNYSIESHSNIILRVVLSKILPRIYKYSEEELEFFCHQNYNNPYFDLVKYLKPLQEFEQLYNKILQKQKKLSIIINRCWIDVKIKETQKASTIFIDIDKYPAHKDIIGKVCGETFQLPNISLTYEIVEIYNKQKSEAEKMFGIMEFKTSHNQ